VNGDRDNYSRTDSLWRDLCHWYGVSNPDEVQSLTLHPDGTVTTS
jgi:hypothetical protein